jgi:hypothetical protein
MIVTIERAAGVADLVYRRIHKRITSIPVGFTRVRALRELKNSATCDCYWIFRQYSVPYKDDISVDLRVPPGLQVGLGMTRETATNRTNNRAVRDRPIFPYSLYSNIQRTQARRSKARSRIARVVQIPGTP